ncbi:MAG: serine protease [Gemmataceae bacterium]|nr:serine protease [Gemmataceae bacterium]
MKPLKSIVLALTAAAVLSACFAGAADNDKQFTLLDKFLLPPGAEINATPTQISQAFLRPALDPWKPAADEEKIRGAGADVYPKVAPAVVVVRAGAGHGTGVVFDPDGWILTNHHVISDAAIDPTNGALVATIFFGRMNGDFMRLVDEGIPAHVYKTDETRDLALLKLTRKPKGMDKLPSVDLAGGAGKPGSDCVAIGHPGSGVLWTVRSGEITGAGDWPKEMTDIVTAGLAVAGKDKERLSMLLAKAPQRKVLVSNVGINFGDSGGPLLDAKGKLIAITFAMPKAENRGTAKFSYHVHLDEVKAFAEMKPKTPLVMVPDPWPVGVFSTVLDLDEDGTPDTLVFGSEREKAISGVMMDLKQASDKNFKPSDLADPTKRDGWKFSFVLQSAPALRAFYDTDGDGKIDLILTSSKRNGEVDSVLRLDKDIWKVEEAKDRKLLDPALFADKAMRERFIKIVTKLGK